MILAYVSELTLEQYKLFESLLSPESKCGRPRTVNLMLVLQAMLYVLRSGCAWRLLPKEYPPYSTVYYYFRQWRDDGTWKRIHDHLVQWVRWMPTVKQAQPQPVEISKPLPVRSWFIKLWAMMAARKSKGVNALLWLIPWAC